ncbi:hypothetical protein DsansV1_C23g0180261 [Dioscorea sansibarensis]
MKQHYIPGYSPSHRMLWQKLPSKLDQQPRNISINCNKHRRRNDTEQQDYLMFDVTAEDMKQKSIVSNVLL